MARVGAMFGVLAALGGATPALAGGMTASANGAAQAEVVAPLVATREADLDFGTIFAGAAAGTVTVSAAGGIAYGGGVQAACIGGACNEPHAAQFAVSGERGRSYVVAVPATVMANGSADNGGSLPALVVTALTVRSDSRPDAGAAGQLDGNGRDRFQIGGTLQVPAGLPASHYRATVAVLVTYG